MKMSYKIALIVSVAVFVFAVFKFIGPSETAETPPVVEAEADATGQAEATPRKSLLSDASEAKQPPKTNKPTQTPSPKTGRSLADDVRSRILAVDKEKTKEPDVIASTTPDEEAGEVEKPDAIALTRTDTDTSVPSIKADATPAPSTSPTSAISSADLDAILGTTSAPKADTLATATEDTKNDSTSPPSQPEEKITISGSTYIVQPSDTFSAIAKKHYGDEAKWFDIAQANPTVDPTRLRVGQELKLPAMAALKETEEPVPAGPEGVKTYTIRPGDNLSTVADNAYGDPTLWRVIYNFNRKKIGDNPNAIQAGMTLKVPPRVNGAR